MYIVKTRARLQCNIAVRRGNTMDLRDRQVVSAASILCIQVKDSQQHPELADPRTIRGDVKSQVTS